MNKKLRPIVKWTGGKYSEFTLFAHEIPAFDRYIEPFFGGGGVFFALQPKVKSLLNDKSTDLINFYQQIGNPNLETELLKYALAWDELGVLSQKMWKNCGSQVIGFLNDKFPLPKLTATLKKSLTSLLELTLIFSDVAFILDAQLFKKMMLASMIDKAKRIKQICEKETRVFTDEEMRIHFETGIRSGAYLFFRAILNQNFDNVGQIDPIKAVANWYFVREFCYGSMFRFNSKGQFNIPYGGISYNKKNFRRKVENIFSPAVISLFKETEISNLDFEVFLNQQVLHQNDFIFLDPPYDSEFSEYDQSAFTRQDQARLADLLINVRAKWMVVIKETSFIRKIYTHPSIKIKVFYKNYTYNVRGRNDRNVQHLIITNY